MNTKLIDLYKSILTCAGMVSDGEGFVFVKMGNDKSPARTSDGKQIVLPTNDQLMNGDRSNRVIFHPLSENIMRSGESEVISKLRSIFNIKINYTFAAISQSLLTLCASIADHRKLTPDQSEMLSVIKDVDEKTIVAFTSMMLHSLKENPEKSFINIYLKRKAMFGDKIYARGGVVTFPLYNELIKDQDKYYGVKLRSKDKIAFLQLYQYIFPCIDDPQSYNRGSNSDVAPFIDALMNTVMSISSKFNDIIELFGPIIDSHEDLIFNSDWVECFENLQDLVPQIRQVPVQAGNEGKAAVEHMQISPTQAPQQALVYHQPTPNAGFPQHNVYHSNQPPALVITDKGVNFDSYLRANPQVAAATMQTNYFGNQGVQMANNPATRTPGWERDAQQSMMNTGYMNQQPVYPTAMRQAWPVQGNYGGNL